MLLKWNFKLRKMSIFDTFFFFNDNSKTAKAACDFCGVYGTAAIAERMPSSKMKTLI